MAAKTPAQWKTLFENVPFHRENYYTGPLGPDYTPGGTCLRLWAPTAEAVTVTLYHKGDGGAVLGTKPLVRGAQGVWSVWLPGEQHGGGSKRRPQHDRRPCPHRTLRVGAGCSPQHSPGTARRVGGERAGLLAGCRQRGAPGVAG